MGFDAEERIGGAAVATEMFVMRLKARTPPAVTAAGTRRKRRGCKVINGYSSSGGERGGEAPAHLASPLGTKLESPF
jgi:hypothetical protein